MIRATQFQVDERNQNTSSNFMGKKSHDPKYPIQVVPLAKEYISVSLEGF